MLHILIVYTFFNFLFVNNFNLFSLCPQLVVKTEYTDTLISSYFTYLLYDREFTDWAKMLILAFTSITGGSLSGLLVGECVG